jgi:hypothetical protein
LIEHGKNVGAMRCRDDAVGGVSKSSEDRLSMNLAKRQLLASRSEWRHFLSRPLQVARECIAIMHSLTPWGTSLN